MIFGFLIFLEAWGAIFTGWVKRAFIEPRYTFPFIDFSWLHPLPGNGMYYYYILMGIAGLMVMVGLYYRFAISIYAIMWAAVYFMQKTHYNNHYYLLMLLCLLMCIVPANRYASMDVRRNSRLKSLTCPQWCLWLFALQISIVYIYAAVAKMYPDWLEARPIAIWFQHKKDYFLIGTLLQQQWFQYAVAYGGILFDLLIVPALIWRKTRKYAFITAIFFHLFNSAVFQVGIFPYMGIALTVFFFDPEVIRRRFFKRKHIPVLKKSYPYCPLAIYALAAYFSLQLALPMRHLFFPGNVNWTEEGHKLSWRMMLRVKSGIVIFHVKDPISNRQWHVNPVKYLSYKQANLVAVRPDMCWQFVQILKEDYRRMGYPEVAIYAKGNVSLNGRPRQPLYNADINLAQVCWQRFAHTEWILPYVDKQKNN